MLVFANPTKRPRRAAPTKKGGPMATKKRKKTTRRKVKNPGFFGFGRKKTARRRARRNPSGFMGAAKGLFGEMLSKDGVTMLAAAALTPTAVDFIKDKLAPKVTGWTGMAVRAGIVAGLAWATDRFVGRKAALTVGAVGLGTLVAEGINLARAKSAGLSDELADVAAQRPELIDHFAQGYQTGAMGEYGMGLSAFPAQSPQAFDFN